jgi:hypothetical protein
MSEQERAIVRACLEQVLVGMVEAREVRSWWIRLSEVNRQAWWEFAVLVASAYKVLKE